MSEREKFRAVQSALGVDPATGIPNDATKKAFVDLWDSALREYREGEGKADGEKEPEDNKPGLVITPDHYLVGATRVKFPAGAKLTPEILVIHFTAGATGDSSIEYWRKLGNGVCAHLVIERDGTTKQVRPFNQQCGHAGVSRWRGKTGVNQFGIGIEIANAGDDDAALKWARKQPGFAGITAKHRNGGPLEEWEGYPAAQFQAVKAAAMALVARYKLEDVTGHDCIAPERKNDPGPAFPMKELREACGFQGLPEVFKK